MENKALNEPNYCYTASTTEAGAYIATFEYREKWIPYTEKLLPISFTMNKVQFGTAFEETYVFYNAEKLAEFAKTQPFGDLFVLKVSGEYKTYGGPPHQRQELLNRLRELGGARL